MEISDWFTIITILLAVSAFFPFVERKVLYLKLSPWKVWLSGIFFFVLLPLLIYFDDLRTIFPILANEPFSVKSKYIPQAKTWAFILFLLITIYWLWWFLFCLKKVNPNERLVNYYLESMNTVEFDKLFRIIMKYESIQLRQPNNFTIYHPLLTNEYFFYRAIDFSPEIYLKAIQNLDVEILLNSRIPLIIRDKVNELTAEQRRIGVSSIYNTEPIFHRNWPKENLLLFYLTDCYFAIMKSCLNKNTFHSEESGFTMLNSFMETMFSEILKSIRIPEGLNIQEGGPTYFHRLLTNILSALGEWISTLKEKNESDALYLFLSLYSQCIYKLTAYNNSIISKNFLNNQFTSLMRIYCEGGSSTSNQIIDNMRLKIEEQLAPNYFDDRRYYKDRFRDAWTHAEKDIEISSKYSEAYNRFLTNVVNKILGME
ncbi:MAG: hypothetical protein H3C36_00470 [Chitinophagaceae bacterium]|nr:hypothetical protein [Chitinophagaceae bacterium]MCO5286699.1 hypothetical protein [Chitinophagaceae bacterium]MCW5915337.1 hypothetical protein [Chitinophagaceae bacterium]MCZ2397764.1 hypothetical protein [Chitinophagales bacterium]